MMVDSLAAYGGNDLNELWTGLESVEGFQEDLKCFQSYNKKEVKIMTIAAL